LTLKELPNGLAHLPPVLARRGGLRSPLLANGLRMPAAMGTKQIIICNNYYRINFRNPQQKSASHLWKALSFFAYILASA
jgi:hypothetical protein